jgi:hypothetical protein
MTKWLAVAVASGVVASLAAGCSSSAPAITPADFCTQKATEECKYVQPVCEPGGLSMASCISYRTNVCTQDYQSAINGGRRVFNPGAVAACIAQIDSGYGSLVAGSNETLLYSAITGPTGDTSTVDYVCESVFQGAIQQNGTCTTSYDCANSSDVCTPAAFGSSTDVCYTLNTVPDQSPCGNPGDVCVAGDSCQKNSNGEPLCQAAASGSLGGVGASCKTDANCDPSSAGFCDIYAKSATCQVGYNFGYGYDCKAYGGS